MLFKIQTALLISEVDCLALPQQLKGEKKNIEP